MGPATAGQFTLFFILLVFSLVKTPRRGLPFHCDSLLIPTFHLFTLSACAPVCLIAQIPTVRARRGPSRQPRRPLRDGPECAQLVLPLPHSLGHYSWYATSFTDFLSCLCLSTTTIIAPVSFLPSFLIHYYITIFFCTAGTIFGFLFLCFLAYLEYRRRVKKAAMER